MKATSRRWWSRSEARRRAGASARENRFRLLYDRYEIGQIVQLGTVDAALKAPPSESIKRSPLPPPASAPASAMRPRQVAGHRDRHPDVPRGDIFCIGPRGW